MPEFRQNRITGEWVIIASERASRPEDFHRDVSKPKPPTHNPACPFCPGNERMTPTEIIADRPPDTAPDSEGWNVRVVPNKYPALDPSSEVDWFEEANLFNGIAGFGVHDVFIDTPRHDLTIATMSRRAVEKLFFVYRARYNQLEKNEKILMINIFRNYGVKAGASLEHPHSQVLATPIIPTRTQIRLNVAKEYYDIHKRCIVCDTIEATLKAKERVVLETERFIVFEPFASQSPFETWVAPKRHCASFGETLDAEIVELAQIMRDILHRIYVGLGDPDYNYFIQANPARTKHRDKYHWFVQIMPRVVPSVGFELSSGIYICTSKPEDTARFLRSISSPR
ncbi:MAG: Galactose-1-phosphate uridylyltransferase [bacterium ADurb.Bin236]|nr:MAG: Galactose-1-phosphate uridylyltransferase [bacterium ADurb.Bin236]HPN95480.1 galactose-1-phosphate uridylyltransferase [bacterium]